ncbi:MAG: thioredoxin family protein [Bacteroides sp.]|nr:thioredoxin family protein [Bacteroides sp.]
MVLSTLAGCIKEYEDTDSEGANLTIGDPIPSLDLLLSDNSRINEEHLSDKISVILLFTTECRDCRKQLPIVDQFYRYYQKNEEVVIFGISRENPKEQVKKYWQENGLTIPYSAQRDKSIYNLFATHTVPRIYISNRQGIIQAIFKDDPLATLAELKEITESLLKQE